MCNMVILNKSLKGKRIKERLLISNGYVVLSQLPKDYVKVSIQGSWRRVYKVDLDIGIIYFDGDLNGRYVEVEYKSDGILFWLSCGYK